MNMLTIFEHFANLGVRFITISKMWSLLVRKLSNLYELSHPSSSVLVTNPMWSNICEPSSWQICTIWCTWNGLYRCYIDKWVFLCCTYQNRPAHWVRKCRNIANSSVTVVRLTCFRLRWGILLSAIWRWVLWRHKSHDDFFSLFLKCPTCTPFYAMATLAANINRYGILSGGKSGEAIYLRDRSTIQTGWGVRGGNLSEGGEATCQGGGGH